MRGFVYPRFVFGCRVSGATRNENKPDSLTVRQNEGTVVEYTMKQVLIVAAILSFIGCGGEPSNAEIARGMKEIFMRETGAYSANLDAQARKIGKGRWVVRLTAERYGERRTLNATAVMDKNGDIHYYTD